MPTTRRLRIQQASGAAAPRLIGIRAPTATRNIQHHPPTPLQCPATPAPPRSGAPQSARLGKPSPNPHRASLLNVDQLATWRDGHVEERDSGAAGCCCFSLERRASLQFGVRVCRRGRLGCRLLPWDFERFLERVHQRRSQLRSRAWRAVPATGAATVGATDHCVLPERREGRLEASTSRRASIRVSVSSERVVVWSRRALRESEADSKRGLLFVRRIDRCSMCDSVGHRRALHVWGVPIRASCAVRQRRRERRRCRSSTTRSSYSRRSAAVSFCYLGFVLHHDCSE